MCGNKASLTQRHSSFCCDGSGISCLGSRREFWRGLLFVYGLFLFRIVDMRVGVWQRGQSIGRHFDGTCQVLTCQQSPIVLVVVSLCDSGNENYFARCYICRTALCWRHLLSIPEPFDCQLCSPFPNDCNIRMLVCT